MVNEKLTESDEGPEGKNKPAKGKPGKLFGFSFTTLILLLVALFFYFNFHTVVVSGNSMYPTFPNGQRLLACKAYWLVGPIKDKDVIVIQRPKEYIIKRVYRTGGQTVDFPNAPTFWDITQGEYRVPEGYVYVLGDNRPVSEDSRAFGPVPVDSVIGKILRL